jgi:methionyl-tRNA synthetase
MNLARLGNKYLADKDPWILIRTDKEKTAGVLNVALQISANLSALIEPFLPGTTKKLTGYLNMDPLKWSEIGNSNVLQPGHTLNESKLLFEKIEDKPIQEQLDKLARIKKQNESAALGLEPAKGIISYDEFNKMDIRIGKILSAEKVPKTDKLLKLVIDTGLDTRTIVSGIAEYFKPEELSGKQVSVLANLAPRNIKGIESRGMILLAEEPGGKLVFVIPEEGTFLGSAVK